MTETRLLIGSLSNDLFRVANLAQRGVDSGATRFLHEAKKWAVQLTDKSLPDYILKIAADVSKQESKISLQVAEKYLMYGILLQNQALQLIRQSRQDPV